MFEKIIKWYKLGLWNDNMVREAAVKNIITETQLKEILKEV